MNTNVATPRQKGIPADTDIESDNANDGLYKTPVALQKKRGTAPLAIESSESEDEELVSKVEVGKKKKGRDIASLVIRHTNYCANIEVRWHQVSDFRWNPAHRLY